MNDMGLKKAVEVGSRYGESAILWKTNIPDLDLTCIDPYRAYHRVSQERQDLIYKGACENARKHGFKILRKASLDAVDDFEDGSLDWVNIDGDHTFDAAVQDIIKWAPKVREGGLVLVHDYCAFGMSGVIPAVDAYTNCHRIDPWYVTRDLEPTAFWQRGAERAGLGS
jgi:predicted O-methyltransferase YrrM